MNTDDAQVAAVLAERVTQESPSPVDQHSIMLWCAAAEDPNPRHWVESGSLSLIAPPAMTSTWTQPLPWSPDHNGVRALELHHRLKAALGVPTAVVREVASRYGEPVRVGDRIHAEHHVSHLSPERRSRLGVGYDWTVEVVHRNQRGELVAVDTWSFHGYRPDPQPSGRPGDAGGVVGTAGAAGEANPAIADLVVDISTTRVVSAAAASRDWTPFHHDRSAASAVGLRDIILNTPGHAALVSRWLTGRAVPGGRPVRLSLRLRSPVYPGDRLRITGEVIDETPRSIGLLREVRWEERVGAVVVGTGRATVMAGHGTGDPWGIPLHEWIDIAESGATLTETY